MGVDRDKEKVKKWKKEKEREERQKERAERKRYLPLSESPQEMTSSADEESEYDDEEAAGVAQANVTITNDNANTENTTRPKIGVDIPGMQRSASKKRAPPPTPLVLHPPSSQQIPPVPHIVPPTSTGASDSEESTPPDATGRTRLAYLSKANGDEESSPSSNSDLDRLRDEDREGELEELEEEQEDLEKDLLNVPRKSMYNPQKRRGDYFDASELGFDVGNSSGEGGVSDADDYDLDDPNDRRKSQIVMRAQLDEIEKNLAQFSPRMLRTDLDSDSPAPSFGAAARSPSLSPPGSSTNGYFANGNGKGYSPMPSSPFMPVSNADVFPPTPKLPNHPGMHGEESDEDNDLSQQAAWPAVPYSSLSDKPSPSPAAQHFPPQLAVNGVSAAMPKRFRPSISTTPASSSRASSMHSNASSESELRKRDLAENYPTPAMSPPTSYPAMTPSIGPKNSLNSPLIPLSPDPFGRVPSQAPAIPGTSVGAGSAAGAKRTSKSYWEPPVVIPAAGAPPELQRKPSEGSIADGKSLTSGSATVSSSRFSTDSMNNGEGGQSQRQANRATLMSVKGIRNLWRKSRKESVSIPPGRMEAVSENAWSPLSPPLPNQPRPGNPAIPMMTPPLPPSPNPPLAPPPQRPHRPSMEEMELPDVEVELPPRTPVSAGFPGRPASQWPGPGAGPTGPSPRPSLSQERRPSTSTTSSGRPSLHERRPSMGQGQERRPSVSQERRPSQDQSLGVPSRRASPDGMPPPPHQFNVPSRRPSPEQVPPLPQPMRRPSDAQSQMSVQSHMSFQSQLSVPPPMLQSTKTGPIIAAKAGPPRHATNDGLLWDQESPYPTRIGPPSRAPSVSSSSPSRPASRPPSPPYPSPPQHQSPPHQSPLHQSPTPPPSTANTSPPPPIPINPSPPAPEKERRSSVRKSILKWKSQTNTNNGSAVPAPLTPSAATFRTRKTSLSGSPSQGSPLTLPMDIPPSPKIPEQFITSYVGSHPPPPAPAARPNSAAIARRRLSAKMASTSTDSSGSRRQSQAHHRPRGSTASSAHSEDTRDTHESTSLDTSAFEIISPKMGGQLSFPYTDLDHDRPALAG
ncbi:hypothetical protein R3P38DRAFT_2820618 [Favolaschia claudopus]|uniref:Uncharacterized protein n=1 Tax=Favolaschia claudopus TaxID=2862362 RepID=A0AAW0EDT3_9AGAR